MIVSVDSVNQLTDLLDDALNYVSQAQIIVGDSSRKGSDLLHNMGERIERRIANEIAEWTE